MLEGSGRLSFEGGVYHLHLSLERQFWITAMCREGVVWDTRILPPWPTSSHERYYVLLEGRVELFGPTRVVLDRPCAFRATASVFEGYENRRPIGFRASGEPIRVLELLLPSGGEPGGRPPEWSLVDAPSDLIARCDAFELESRLSGCGPALARRRRELLERFVEIGWLSEEAVASIVEEEAPHIARTWGAFVPVFRDFTLSPALVDVAERAMLSVRQLDRNFGELFERFRIAGESWRTAMHRFRLGMAVLLLSAEPATVAAVAKSVGYARPEAMTAAFRAAGMPAPSAIRELVRGDA
jgi:AraC-like DNA-binding protein